MKSWLLLPMLSLFAAEARGQVPESTTQCIDSSTRAQSLRDAGRLLEAQRTLAQCVLETCPPSVRKGCGDWIMDIDARLPSMVVRVVDEDQQDIERARAWIDGSVTSLDGRATIVDPGKHIVVAELANGERSQTQVILAEAEKRRIVTLSFARTSKTKLVLLGIGGASLGVAGLFGFLGMRQWADLQANCRPRCAQEDINSVQAKFIAGDIALGVSVVTLGIAAALYISGSRSKSAMSHSPFVF